MKSFEEFRKEWKKNRPPTLFDQLKEEAQNRKECTYIPSEEELEFYHNYIKPHCEEMLRRVYEEEEEDND